MTRGVLLFHTTSAVMRAEKSLLTEGVRIQLIPTPREFSSDCGISIRFEWADLSQIQALISQGNLEFDSIQEIVDSPGKGHNT
jgi:hypothetical protein